MGARRKSARHPGQRRSVKPRAAPRVNRELAVNFEANPIGIARLVERVFVSVNPEVERILGRSAAELIGRDAKFLYADPADYRQTGERIRGAVAAGETYRGEHLIKRPDGSTFWCELRARAADAADPAMGIVFAARDITREKALAQALREAEFIVQNAALPIFLTDPQGRFVRTNPAGCALYGYTKEELYRMTVFDVNTEATPQGWRNHFAILRKEGRRSYETTLRRRDGRTFPAEVHGNLFVLEGREYNCSFVSDISERRQAADALAESNRFKSEFIARM